MDQQTITRHLLQQEEEEDDRYISVSMGVGHVQPGMCKFLIHPLLFSQLCYVTVTCLLCLEMQLSCHSQRVETNFISVRKL